MFRITAPGTTNRYGGSSRAAAYGIDDIPRCQVVRKTQNCSMMAAAGRSCTFRMVLKTWNKNPVTTRHRCSMDDCIRALFNKSDGIKCLAAFSGK